MAKDKLNNMLSFKDYSTLCKLENKPGKVLENLNHLNRYEDYKNIDEGFVTNLLKKVGLVKLTDDEIKLKAESIINDKDKLSRLLSAINLSSNPKLHQDNYKKLKEKGGLPYYAFVLFLYKNIDELKNKRPIYYNVDNIGVKDTRVLDPVNASGT